MARPTRPRAPARPGALLLLLLFAGCTTSEDPAGDTQRDAERIRFREVPDAFGAWYRDSNRALPNGGEGLGGGAWLDYDGDVDLDLFLPNGKAGTSGLFRNDGGVFTNVAEEAGVATSTGHSGVVAGDVNGDGLPDLLVLGEGHMVYADQSPTYLFLNHGDGTFQDATGPSNILPGDSALSAAMADVDHDGLLDIFIARPGHLDVSAALGLPEGTLGGPGAAHRDTLYRNLGVGEDGSVTFEDISASAGVDTAFGACAASFSDVDGDGWQDLVVANCNDIDGKPTPIELFHNNGDLTFTDVAAEAHVGALGYWMGLALADFDRDGDTDLFAVNFGPMPAGVKADPQFTDHALYRNEGGGEFTDLAAELGLSRGPFGWGATAGDFDNDGHADLYYAGSYPFLGAIGPDYGNPGTLLFNDGAGALAPAEAGAAGPDLRNRFTSGVARADYDGDGFVDVLVVADTQLIQRTDWGTPVLLHNEGSENRSVTLRLRGSAPNTGAIGAKVYLLDQPAEAAPLEDILVPGQLQSTEIQAGSSFASSESPWPTFGLGQADHGFALVVWPLGTVEYFGEVAAGKAVDVVEGEGVWSR